MSKTRRKDLPTPPSEGKKKLNFRELFKLLPGYDPFANPGDSWFDEDLAQFCCDFFPEILTHVEGDLAGKPFVLQPWQQAIVGCLFGWLRKDAAGRTVRRYREAFIYVPRKNGKTPLAAGICMLVLFCDGERGAQIYSAAADTDQAAILYRHARGMVENSPKLSGMAKIYGGSNHRSIVLNADQASVYRVLSSDANTKHGGNSHLVLVDELHAQPNRELVDVLKTSLASENRKQPLMLYITTADFKRESICNEKLDYAKRVASGAVIDPSFFPVIYECTDKDDWKSPATWAKANPNLGISVSLRYLEDECKQAQAVPGYENTFKRLHLNLQTENDVAWINMERWLGLPHGMTADELEGRECYGGLDLSAKIDITAFVLVFPPTADEVFDATAEGKKAIWRLISYFWMPKNNIQHRERRDHVPYQLWVNQGWLHATEGDVVDYDAVKLQVHAAARKFQLRQIGYDTWNANQIAIQLNDEAGRGNGKDGLMLEFGQGFRSMSEPAKEFEKMIVDGTIATDGNPLMTEMVRNCAIEVDPAGNIKPSKKKSTKRIDGVVAACMGIGLAIAKDPSGGRSVLDTRGLLVI